MPIQNFLLLYNEGTNTIEEYLITFNLKKLKNYTESLVSTNDKDLVLKRILEASWLGHYVPVTKGILAPSKIKYLNNYVCNETGDELYYDRKKNIVQIDYDSCLSKEQKVQYIRTYLELLNFTLINVTDFSIFENAYNELEKLNITGITQTLRSIETIITSSKLAKDLFDEVDFSLNSPHKQLIKNI